MKRNKQILNSDHPEFSTLPSYFFIQHKKTAARQIQRWASLYLFRNSLFIEGESTFHLFHAIGFSFGTLSILHPCFNNLT